MFYSLAWCSSPPHTIVMTYAALSIDRLEPKFVRQGRVLVHTKAFFRKYRPTRGLETDMTELTWDDDDVGVAILLPIKHMTKLVWLEGALDVSMSIRNILEADGDGGRLLSLAAYTCELELDIATASDDPVPATSALA